MATQWSYKDEMVMQMYVPYGVCCAGKAAIVLDGRAATEELFVDERVVDELAGFVELLLLSKLLEFLLLVLATELVEDFNVDVMTLEDVFLLDVLANKDAGLLERADVEETNLEELLLSLRLELEDSIGLTVLLARILDVEVAGVKQVLTVVKFV
jgi:hypothetical protein